MQKLKAIGERNKVEQEPENRKKKILELNNLLSEKRSEMDRLQVELDSLNKVESE